MGMFDSVYFDCPYCNHKTEAQSKSGPCTLETYSSAAVPLTVALDLLSGRGYLECSNCDRRYKAIAPDFHIPDTLRLIAQIIPDSEKRLNDGKCGNCKGKYCECFYGQWLKALESADE